MPPLCRREFDEEFGTSKRTIPPDTKTYWKTVKKWGMTPRELLTYVMKQKLPVKVFRQEMYWKWASGELMGEQYPVE